MQKPDNLAAKKAIIKNYKGAAKRRDYEWTLTFDEAVNFITNNCFYCGVEPSTTFWHRGAKESSLQRSRPYLYNGIDRVENTIGYTRENCVSCCSICNNSKACLSVEEWTVWIQRIYKKMFNDYPEGEYIQVDGNGELPFKKEEDIVWPI